MIVSLCTNIWKLFFLIFIKIIDNIFFNLIIFPLRGLQHEPSRNRDTKNSVVFDMSWIRTYEELLDFQIHKDVLAVFAKWNRVTTGLTFLMIDQSNVYRISCDRVTRNKRNYTIYDTFFIIVTQQLCVLVEQPGVIRSL